MRSRKPGGDHAPHSRGPPPPGPGWGPGGLSFGARSSARGGRVRGGLPGAHCAYLQAGWGRGGRPVCPRLTGCVITLTIAPLSSRPPRPCPRPRLRMWAAAPLLWLRGREGRWCHGAAVLARPAEWAGGSPPRDAWGGGARAFLDRPPGTGPRLLEVCTEKRVPPCPRTQPRPPLARGHLPPNHSPAVTHGTARPPGGSQGAVRACAQGSHTGSLTSLFSKSPAGTEIPRKKTQN